MTDTTTEKPKIGKKTAAAKPDLGQLGEVARVFITEGPEAAAKIEGAEEVRANIASSVHHLAEESKPWIRRFVNRFRNTTPGTVVESAGTIGGVVVFGYGVKVAASWLFSRVFGSSSSDDNLIEG